MKKSIRRISLFLAMLLIFSAFSVVTASAASYPLIICQSSYDTFIEGTVGKLEFLIWHEYKNEKYTVEIYDENGRRLGSVSDTMYNVNHSTELSITVDTRDLELKPGKYTVKYHMSFYTLYSWHDAPNVYTSYFYVVEDTCKGNHSFGEPTIYSDPTCEKDGSGYKTCSKCSYRQDVTVPKGEHDWDDGVVTTEPTCTKDGVKTFTCSVCDETKTESIAKGKHEYDYYESVSNKKHQTTCIHCGKSVTSEHNWDKGTVIVQPTATKTGSAEYTCKDCGHQITKTLPKLTRGDVNSDGTIDQFDYVLVKRAYFETYTLSIAEEYCADVNFDKVVDQFDYVLLKRVYFDTYTIPEEPKTENESSVDEKSEAPEESKAPVTEEPTSKPTTSSDAFDQIGKYIMNNGTPHYEEYYISKNLKDNAFLVFYYDPTEDLFTISLSLTASDSSTFYMIDIYKKDSLHSASLMYSLTTDDSGDFCGGKINAATFSENNKEIISVWYMGDHESLSGSFETLLGSGVNLMLIAVSEMIADMNLGVDMSDIGFVNY